MQQFTGFLLSIAVAFVSGTPFTWFAGFKEPHVAPSQG